MEIDIKQRLNELKAKEHELTLQYTELMKEVMLKRGLTELLVVPLDCNGDLMFDFQYENCCGEWNLDWSDLRCGSSSVITRFAIIDGVLSYHTSYFQGYYEVPPFKTEKKNTPWHSVTDITDNLNLRNLFVKCLTDDFFWNFTEKHPGSRILDFDFKIDEYIKKRRSDVNLSYAFSGLSKIKFMDLKGLGNIPIESIDGIFMGCKSLKELDLSGLDFSDCGYFCSDVFDGCKSLKTIYLYGCNDGSINVIKNLLEEADLKQKIEVIH